jgi:hypothetical protein
MSFKQKYLKYKSKYLALKNQANNLQKGGSLYHKTEEKVKNLTLNSKIKLFNEDNVLALENLSITPSMTEVYGYSFKSGGSINSSDFKNLSKLLSRDNNTGTETTESIESDSKTEDSKTEDSKTEDSKTEDSKTKDSKTKDSKTEETASIQYGGKKKTKNNKKYFFDNSDLELNTTDSNLSSLDSDDLDSDDL